MLRTLRTAMNSILSAIESLIQSGRTISSDIMTAAASEIRRLTQGIQSLQSGAAQTPPPVPPPEPPLENAMPSSVINAFNFDPASNSLRVQFRGRFPNAEGSIYQYENVPNEIFELFRRGAVPARTRGSNRWGNWWEGKHPSMGSSMNVLLRGLNLPYQRLS